MTVIFAVYHIGSSTYARRVTTFGAALRGDFLLDPDLTYLNHGTVGVAHRQVLAAQRAIVDEIERNPADFILRRLADFDHTMAGPSLVRQAIVPVAEFVGAEPSDLVFTDNITAAANAVLRSFPFDPGDEVLVTDLGYGGVTNAVRYATRVAGATMRTITLPWPTLSADDSADAVAAAIGPRTRLLVIDHLTARTALVLPLAQIAQACHERGVLVFADGAHVPGNLPLNIAGLGVDWYAANLHKWALAPRSCGILWTSREHQAHLHPPVISWGLDNGIDAEFDLPGTRDPSAWLAAPVGIEVLRGYGLDDVFTHNHDLAWRSAKRLSDRWDTPLTTPEAMVAAMVTLRLPDRWGPNDAAAAHLTTELQRRRVEVPLFAAADALWIRISTHVHNDDNDIDRLLDAVDDIV